MNEIVQARFIKSTCRVKNVHSHSHAKHASFFNFNVCIRPSVHGFFNCKGHSTANVAAWSSSSLVGLKIKYLWISWGGFQCLDFGEKSATVVWENPSAI